MRELSFDQISLGLVLWGLLATTVISYVVSVVRLHILGPKAPLVGTKSSLEPRFFANLRFFLNPGAVIGEGYRKVHIGQYDLSDHFWRLNVRV